MSHPRGERLLGSEVAGLRFCDLVETVVIDSVRHKGDIIPQSSDINGSGSNSAAVVPKSANGIDSGVRACLSAISARN